MVTILSSFPYSPSHTAMRVSNFCSKVPGRVKLSPLKSIWNTGYSAHSVSSRSIASPLNKSFRPSK